MFNDVDLVTNMTANLYEDIALATLRHSQKTAIEALRNPNLTDAEKVQAIHNIMKIGDFEAQKMGIKAMKLKEQLK